MERFNIGVNDFDAKEFLVKAMCFLYQNSF